ncbi:hypothetical protein KXS11_06525 [Plantibacter flavus]|uniref:hypothetical protein n=1 Tax=Plantibacter flavus TaxID=150123 RepID=UPI003F15FD40
MTALPEDAPLTRRQARASQQQLPATDEASDSTPARRRRASTSEPVAGGEIPQATPAGEPSAPASAAEAAAPAPVSAPAAAPTSSGAPSAAATGGLTRRQLRELERTGSIEQIPAPATPVAPPVEEKAPSVALPPRTPEQVVAPTPKQNKAAKQQAAKAAQQEAAAAAATKAAERAASERQESERAAAERQAADRKATARAAAKAAEDAAAAERAAQTRSAQAPAPETTPAQAATGSLFDVSDRDDISEDPASTLSKGFGRDSMLVAALEAEKAASTESGVAFEDLLGNGMTTTGQITTSSLIIPVAPAQAEAGATSNSTGEILITGTIDLPRGLGSSGQDPNHFDGAGIDRLIEGDELPASVTAASPVAASKAVSSHGSTRDVVPATTNQSNKLLMTLAIAAAVLAAGVIAVLIIGFLGGAF